MCAFGEQVCEALELCEVSELAGHCLAAFRLKTDKESTETFVLLCDHLEISSVLKMENSEALQTMKCKIFSWKMRIHM